MKTKITLLMLGLFFMVSHVKSQIFPPFDSIGKVILFADSLVAKNDINITIKKLSKEINEKEADGLDLKYYNLAICYAAKKQPDKVIYYLTKCAETSFNYVGLMQIDTDFRFLLDTPGWKKLVAKTDSVYLLQYPEITHKDISVELYHILLKDQQWRGLGIKKHDLTLQSSDSVNLVRVRAIIRQNGWPTYSMVGELAAQGAFLTIQHSETAVQRKYVQMVVIAAAMNEASKEWAALLIDRISVHLKGMQIYGTQVYRTRDSISGEYGNYKYFPIKDETIVDSLRLEMGLISLKEYLKMFDIEYMPDSE